MTSTSSTIDSWEQYPRNLPPSLYNTGREAQHLVLQQNAGRIFACRDDVEVWKSDGNSAAQLKREKLNGTFDLDLDFCAYFIHQRSSWGYLQVCRETILKLFTTYAIPPVVLDATFSFGSKVTGEDDTYFNICHRILVPSSERGQVPGVNSPYYELCYILRYFEKHGRPDLKQEWSLRQMMVYQRYHLHTRKTIWIVIQPSQRGKALLWKHLCQPQHSMSAHALLLTTGLSDWRWYLNDIRLSLLQYTEKAIHSSLPFRKIDYDTEFKDNQRLLILSNNLSVAEAVLESTLDVAHAIQTQCTDIKSASMHQPEDDRELLGTVALDIQRIKSFQRTAKALRREAGGTSQLLIKLLDYRKADIQNTHVAALRSISIASNAQSDGLRALTEKTHKDSRSVKILTFIAMVYLPASLIAAIFSTDLVQIPEIVDTGNSRVVILNKAMWVYILSTVALTVITLGGIFLWDRRSIV